jgi:hypothetical protein
MVLVKNKVEKLLLFSLILPATAGALESYKQGVWGSFGKHAKFWWEKN